MSAEAAEAERAWWRRHAILFQQVAEQQHKRAVARAHNRSKRREAINKAFGDLCEASEGSAVTWRRMGLSLDELFAEASAEGDVWLMQNIIRYQRAICTRRINRLTHQEKRPHYYEQEKKRRLTLAHERRVATQRRTENPCPTKEQLLEAWLVAKDSDANLIRFGSLIQDLECYVNNTLRRNEAGEIIGRNGGIKQWLAENIPVLRLKYHTVMRYKQAAKKLRQIVDLHDPVPVARILEEPPAPRTEAATPSEEVATAAKEAATAPKEATAEQSVREVALLRARAIYLEVTNPAPANRTAFLERLSAYLDPLRVEEATTLRLWREKYAAAITVRTKNGWRQRLFEKVWAKVPYAGKRTTTRRT